MTLQQSIYDLLRLSGDLFDLVGDEIYYETLPQNFDFKKPAVVYSARVTNAQSDLGGEVWGNEANARCFCYSPDSLENLDIADAVIEALHGTHGAYNYGITESSDQERNFDLNVWQIATVTEVDYVLDAILAGQPVATDVTIIINNELRVFNFITGSYTYSSPDNIAEGPSLYQWFSADDAAGSNPVLISISNNINLPLPEASEGSFVAFAVTPIDLNGTRGDVVLSAFEGPILGTPLLVSPEVQKVFDRMPNALTQVEQDAMEIYVDVELALGHWPSADGLIQPGTIDEFFMLALVDPANALTGFLQKTATNSGAVHKANEGFTFNGTSDLIDTGFNAATDGINYKLLDAQAGGYSKRFNADTASRAIGGADDGTFDTVPHQANTVLRGIVNHSNERVQIVDVFGNENLWYATTDGVNNQWVKNGLVVGTLAAVPNGIPNFNIGIGARNKTIPSQFFDGIISSFMIGAVLVDQVAHHSNHLEFLINLGFFIDRIILNFPNPLATGEEDAITDFVHTEVRDGNFQKWDSFAMLGLQDEANSLYDWISLNQMTNNGAVHVPGTGFDFNGTTQFIDSGFIPSTDVRNYRQDDAIVGVFNKINNAITTDSMTIFGSYPPSTFRSTLHQSPGTTRLTARVNDNGNRNARSEGFFANDSLYISSRIDGLATVTLHKNGIAQGMFQGDVSTGISDITFYIGARNQAGSDDLHYNGIISSFIAGGAIGFDQLTHYNNLIDFFVTLNFFTDPVINGFPNALAAGEETAIRNLIDLEVANGNFFKYDSFAAFNLQDEANSLFDWIRLSQMTNNGAIHVPGESFEFLGAEWIDTEFNPDTDGRHYQLNSVIAGVFYHSGDAAGGGPPNSEHIISAQTTNTRIQYSDTFSQGSVINVNTTLANTIPEEYPSPLSLEIINRSASNVIDFYRNGLSILTATEVSQSIPATNFFIGVRTDFVQFATAKISSFIAGGSFDANEQLAHYNNYIEYLIELDYFAGPVIASFPVALAVDEDVAIRTFINASVRDKTWFLMDSFACFKLEDEANALHDWKRLSGMTNNGAVHGGNGFTFSGAEHINSNYNPAIDAMNYELNDGGVELFVQNEVNALPAATSGLMGATDGASNGTQLHRITSGIIRFAINQASNPNGPTTDWTQRLVAAIRTGSATLDYFLDGVSVDSATVASSGLPDNPIFIGARNLNGVTDIFWNGTVSTFNIYGAIGFDQSAHHTNLVNLLISL